ncbi:small multi-drug export protein [Alkalihalobacillus sp. LMS39]|uniref:COG2426 family protein n=1 Tax=Alkalihalobacillus sp. LMS39 TaxID=2924032 RepID=UPI001FB55445|nr:small multi-drug export protein [Alkalihalobacillus sp. LMS39]UOE92505.1 small multi-drug export protein [Alkalihalobacillus sp. LMS39]
MEWFEEISDVFIELFQFLPGEMIVMFISALPLLEVRGGLSAGALLEFSFEKTLLLSIIGNIAPIAPLLLLFIPLSRWLTRFKGYEQFYYWLYDRTLRKSDKIEKYGAMGLFLFTALPFPATGVYSACVAALLFFIPVRVAILSISLGVVFTSLIISLFAYPALFGL